MATYTYKLVTKSNVVEGGTISAFSQWAAKRKLTQKNGSTLLVLARNKTPLLKKEIALPAFRIPPFERILFFRNLAIMISAGLSLPESLRVVEDQINSSHIKKAIRHITHDVTNGQTLSRAIGKHKRFFPEHLAETVYLGEKAGELPKTLDRISVDLELNHELKRKVIGAITYPLIVIFVMLAVVTTLMIIVLPNIAQLFSEVGADLPIPTKILLSFSSFISTNPYIIVGIGIGIIAVSLAFVSIKPMRYMLHYTVLKLPVFGGLIQEYNLARFFRAAESLISSGNSLVTAVAVSKKTLRNKLYHTALTSIHTALLHGVPLSETLKGHVFLFPPQTQKLVQVGEQSGKFEETFRHIALYFDRSVHHKTQMLSVMIEPVLMLVIGVFVGGLALSIFLPIYQISTAL
jgi:type IV pilus assembly protein PilC